MMLKNVYQVSIHLLMMGLNLIQSAHKSVVLIDNLLGDPK